MICSRHRAIARSSEYGWPLCYRCFGEARAAAENRALDDKIAAMRRTNGHQHAFPMNGEAAPACLICGFRATNYDSVSALIRRLEGK